jgi:DNA helicase-2/ATP-dependent DNA helicase PcrA
MEPTFLNELNKSQREAVLYNDGPSLVIAGAGSGKTRVLTYKIAYLLSKGLPAESILALTFTNKAAREMKARIAEMIGWQQARRLWMGTFHSIFSRILRAEAEHLGYTAHFTIYDSSDSKSLVKSILKDLNLDDKVYAPNTVLNRISMAKNNLFSPQAYKANPDLTTRDYQSKMPQMCEIYQIYAMRCRAANAMDFDDLLYYTNILFRDKPDILEKYKNFFQYILVDEYQDTNFSQYLIINKLSEKHQRLCVVGDDAQSIYSFRGANIDNILGFKREYPNCKIFKLEQNYRSTQNIVNAANSLISKNKEQIQKTVFSENATGEAIEVSSVYSDYDEGFTVANTIARLHGSESPYDEFAILYRTNSQSRVLEESLRKNGIPYRIYGGLSFYQRKEIKDVLAYFRLVINPADDEALKRVINVPKRGIGNTTLEKIFVSAKTHQVSAWQIISNVLQYNVGVNAGTALKLTRFTELIAPFNEKLQEQNAYEIGNAIVRASGIINELKEDHSTESLSRQDNIEELLKAMHEFCELRMEEDGTLATLSDFLSEVSLLTDHDEKEGEDEKKVTLMTVHASKGLEFKHVFIVGMEEELFPSSRIQSERELEEERRLFYVAITRAKETCHISYAKTRFRHGKNNFCNPSRFLKDLDTRFVNMPETNDIFASSTPAFERRSPISFEPRFTAPTRSSKPLKPITSNESSMESKTEINGLQLAMRVIHELFGEGTIISLSGSGADARAVVSFDNVGQKNLLLKYAKLTVM